MAFQFTNWLSSNITNCEYYGPRLTVFALNEYRNVALPEARTITDIRFMISFLSKKKNCFVLALFLNSMLAYASNEPCVKIARRYELEFNTSVKSSNSGIFSDLLTLSIQNGAGMYGEMKDRCVLTISEVCKEFYKCAGNKAKLIYAIHAENITNEFNILLIDGDSAVTSNSYLQTLLRTRNVLSFRPSHKCWSTAGMFWPKHALKIEDIRKLLETFDKSGRDDVAFQSVKSLDIETLNQNYIHHSRGKDIFGKNAVLKLRISNFMISSTTAIVLLIFIFQENKCGRKKWTKMLYAIIMTSLSIALDYLFYVLVNFSMHGKSKYALVNDSRYKWYNSISTSLSICWQTDTPIVRKDLYGTFREISVSKSYALLLYLIAKDYGISIIISGILVKRFRLSLTKLNIKEVLNVSKEFVIEIFFTLLILFLSVCFISLVHGRIYWHDENGYYGLLSTCSDQNCTFSGPKPFLVSFLAQVRYLLPTFSVITWYVVKNGPYDHGLNRVLACIILLALTRSSSVIVDSCSSNAEVETCETRNVFIGERNEFSFEVSLPCDASIMDSQKISIGENSIQIRQVNGSSLPSCWNKVVLLKALCRYDRAPSSILLYDNHVCELDGLSNSVFGGKTRKYAELVIDPQYMNKVVSIIGRYNMKRCHLINAWSRKASNYKKYEKYGDQEGLNEVLHDNPQFSIGKNMLSVKATNNNYKTMAFSAVKDSISVIECFIFITILRVRILKEYYSFVDSLIFGVLGIVAAPKGNVHRDVILESKIYGPTFKVVSHWVQKSKKVVWSLDGDAVEYEDYSRIQYIIGDNTMITVFYFYNFIVLSELVILIIVALGLSDANSVIHLIRNAKKDIKDHNDRSSSKFYRKRRVSS